MFSQLKSVTGNTDFYVISYWNILKRRKLISDIFGF